MGLVRAIRNLFTRRLTLAEFAMAPRQRAAGGPIATVTDPYTQSPWVYAGAQGKARNLASVPFIIKSGDRATRTGSTLPENDPLVRLFARPSPFLSLNGTIEATSIGLDVAGETFWLKLNAAGKWATNGEVPVELQLAQASQFRLEEAGIDPKTGLVREWLVDLKQGRARVPADAVIQFALFNPGSPYRGLSPLEAAVQGIQIEYKADAYAAGMLDNDCTPGGVLTVTGDVTDDEAIALKKKWGDKHRGARNAGEPAVLGEGLTWQSVGFTPKDMVLPHQREWSKEQIMAVLGVTHFEMGSSGDYNRASAVAAKAWLWENSLLPRLSFIEDVLWHRLFRFHRGPGGEVWGEFDTSKVDALRADMTDKVNQAAVMTTIGYGLNDVNDRLELGMPVVDEDVGTPGQGITVGGASDTTPGTPAPAGGGVAIGGDATPLPASGGGVVVKARFHKALRRPMRANAIRLWNERSATIMHRTLGTFYRSVRKLVTVKAQKSLPDLSQQQVEEILGAPQLWQQNARDIFGPAMNGLARSAVRNAGNIIGGFDVVEIEDPRWLLTASRQTGRAIRTAMRWRARIRDRILSAVASGTESVTSLAQLIDREFRTVIRSNGLVIARTETAMIGAQIRNEVFKAEGIDQNEWSAANDAHTRESHAAIDGEVRALGERFSNGLLYPSEPGGPPEEIINCRCVALPRIE